MQRFILFILSSFLLLGCRTQQGTSGAGQKTILSGDNVLMPARRLADSEMSRCPKACQLDFQKSLKWDYSVGVELQAFLNLYEATGDKRYRDYAIAYADTMVNGDGTIKSYKLSEYNIDRVNTGKILFRIFEYTKNEKYRKALALLRRQLDTHPRNADGSFWHKMSYPNQVWLDGVYMATPFIAEYEARYGGTDGYADAVKQIEIAARHTYDAASGMYRHACDLSKTMYWADSRTGQSPHVWGRAMGWYAMAIVDALDFLPQQEAGRDSLLTIMNNIARQLKKVQDGRTGLWYQVLDCGGREGNYLESSCSAMFIYALLKAVRKGYIDSSYRAVAMKAYKGYLKEFVTRDSNGLTSVNQACAVAGLGGKEHRDGSFAYYISEPRRSNDAKAVGPFINAVIEVSKAAN
jgi:unsaturated rhamnogalacturonyl hydrolase